MLYLYLLLPLFLLNTLTASITIRPIVAHTYAVPAPGNTAVAVEVPDPDPELVKSLDLMSIYGGDYTYGQTYTEEQLIEIISKHVNVEQLDLTGQDVTPNIMTAIRNSMSNLKSVNLNGYIRTIPDGYEYWQIAVVLGMPSENLSALFQYDSPIEVLSLKLSGVDGDGLVAIGQGASNLKEIDLSGASNITDYGLSDLVEHSPHLKIIRLESVILHQPGYVGQDEVIKPHITNSLIEKLRGQGIDVITSP